MVLKEFVLIAAETYRTRAYIQTLIKNDFLPSSCVIYLENKDQYISQATLNPTTGINKYFDKEETVLQTICKSKIPYLVIETKDINSQIMIDTIRTIKEKYLIYSGYGGCILQHELFKLGKKIIHIHAGILPKYRGSTTAYYSLLNEGRIGATAIFMNEGIDEGDILTQAMYKLPEEDIDIDNTFEPYIRACVLVKAINSYIENGKFACAPQNSKNAETYYIIHPVLKHIAIMNEKGIK